MPRVTENRLRKIWTATLPDHVIAVGWSPDGTRIAAAVVSGPVSIYPTSEGKPIQTLSGHGFGTTSLDWHPSGSRLATAGQDGHARIWDMETGAEGAKLPGGAGWVERVVWSGDGSLLATAAGKRVRIWDPTGTQLREYANHAATVSDLAWKPGVNLLAVAAYGGVALYDPTQAESLRVYEWKGAPLKLAWSPDGRVLAHGNQDATVHFWFAASQNQEMLQMSGFATKVRELSWDHTGRLLATGGSAAVCVWDCSGKGPEGSKPQLLLEDSAELPITALGWQRRGFLIASTGQDGRVLLWQPANKKAPLVGHDTRPAAGSALAWSPDDRHLAVATANGDLTLYRVT